MKEEVLNILEVDRENANKLLKTGNCILLGVATISTDNEECPNETEFLYSIGQVKYDFCQLCNADTVIYELDKQENRISCVCINGNYECYL